MAAQPLHRDAYQPRTRLALAPAPAPVMVPVVERTVECCECQGRGFDPRGFRCHVCEGNTTLTIRAVSWVDGWAAIVADHYSGRFHFACTVGVAETEELALFGPGGWNVADPYVVNREEALLALGVQP